MMPSPADVLETLRHTGHADRWTALVAGREDLRLTVEKIVSRQPEDVAAALLQHLSAGDRHGPSWARAAIWALELAATQGATAREVIRPGLLRMVGDDGQTFVLAPLAFVGQKTKGADADVERLVSALDGALASYRYTLHIKKPLPADLDPTPIAQAIHLWLGAMRRGSEVGRCASYEDGDIAVEIGLTDLPRRGIESGLLTLIGPKRALERLASVDGRLVHAAGASAEAAPGEPLLCVVAADAPWHMPRGYVHQVLYGTPREVYTRRDGDFRRHEALYRSNGLSLFSDPKCAHLGAVWWVEPAGSVSVRAWSHENPWASEHDRIPVLPGKRFWRREGPTGLHDEAVMVATMDDPVQWSPLP